MMFLLKGGRMSADLSDQLVANWISWCTVELAEDAVFARFLIDHPELWVLSGVPSIDTDAGGDAGD